MRIYRIPLFCLFFLFASNGINLCANQAEENALEAAREFLYQNKLSQYQGMRNQWQGKEKNQEGWFFLDLQALLHHGDRAGAIALLSRKSFKGADEIERLVRLAALYIVEEPDHALDILNEAIRKAPEKADLHTFKASILESANEKKDAEKEYIIAVQMEPENPFIREQLADFYIRSYKYPQAMQLLQDTLSPPSIDSIWLKTLFWSCMVIPSSAVLSMRELPSGGLAPLVSYLIGLPQGVYWDNEQFESVTNSNRYLDQQQETFWLRLVDALKRGNETLAMEFLTYNSFSPVSWAPDIENSLKTILTYRSLHSSENGTFLLKNDDLNDPAQFLSFLANYSHIPANDLQKLIPRAYHDILMSKQIFMLPFLAHGWVEAALQLSVLPVIPKEFPKWVVLLMTQALQQNRSKGIALDFALRQDPFPQESLLIAEFALALDNKPLAIEYLKSIFKRKDTIGEQAARLIEPLLLERGEFQFLREVIRAHPEKASTIESREKLARLAIESGDHVEATFLYAEIEGDSSEAKSFLAAKAYEQQNWPRARKLTEELIALYPNNEEFKANLRDILQKESNKNK